MIKSQLNDLNLAQAMTWLYFNNVRQIQFFGTLKAVGTSNNSIYIVSSSLGLPIESVLSSTTQAYHGTGN